MPASRAQRLALRNQGPYCVLMTQTEPLEAVAPVQALARRVREVRTARGWSAQELAQRCAALGMPALDRSTIANIESGRRQRVGVDELLVLALALGVAPVHLLVPLTEQWYAATPDRVTGTSRVREWVRGNYPMHGADVNDPAARSADREMYLSQRPAPADDWTAPPEPTPEEREDRRRDRLRKLAEAEEAGLVTIQRHGDMWAVTPTAEWTELLGEGDDDGDR